MGKKSFVELLTFMPVWFMEFLFSIAEKLRKYRKSIFKNILKLALGLLLIMIPCSAFWMGFELSSIGPPIIYSDARIRNNIEEIFKVVVPVNTADLIYSGRNESPADCYAAFTLSGQDECERFIQSQFSISLEKFERVNQIEKKYTNIHKGNLELSQSDEYYIYVNSEENSLTIIYDSSQSRILLYKQYPKGLPCFFCRFF